MVVSVVHVANGPVSELCELDGQPTGRVSAYLFHAGGHDDPLPLQANAGLSFQGYVVVGMGFTFDDTDKEGVATPIHLMRQLIAKDKRNAERIFPYIGGQEVNDSPTQAHHRYVINFGEMSEEQARQWPDLMKLVEEKVKPERTKRTGSWSVDKEKRAQRWWLFSRTAKELHAAIRGLERVLVVAQTSNTLAFAFKEAEIVFGHTLIVFPVDRFGFFAVVQSRVHQLWALFFAAKMKDDARYIPSDCFETFPFPDAFETDPRLEQAGHDYYEYRAALMIRNNEGLTKTYNRFHDPNERSADIAKLRELHAAMDRAVLDAYGWTDLQPTCEFLLDYEDEEDEGEPGASATGGRQRKKPWRYRWPDDFRDEVLARLLELNKQRAEAEKLAGEAADAGKKKVRKGKAKKPEAGGLYEVD